MEMNSGTATPVPRGVHRPEATTSFARMSTLGGSVQVKSFEAGTETGVEVEEVR